MVCADDYLPSWFLGMRQLLGVTVLPCELWSKMRIKPSTAELRLTRAGELRLKTVSRITTDSGFKLFIDRGFCDLLGGMDASLWLMPW